MAHTNQETLYAIIEHPKLGKVRGVMRSDTINQLRGIQYATIKDRFARGELLDHIQTTSTNAKENVLDATRFGPTALIPSNACENEHKLFQKALPFTELEQSDTDCLTLNINAPNINDGGDGLPVLVFVHGGGYTTGSSSFPHNDMAMITELSVKLGTPIISVAINYRVGVPGFLTSPEMRAAGYKPNNGLDDQRLGLRWIKNNITGFGGDPNRITFLGESAGASSGFYHLHSTEPNFHQFISMSGTSLLRPRPIAAVEASFHSIAEALGVKGRTPQEQLQRLLSTPQEEFVTKVGRILRLGPVVDGSTIPETTFFASLRDNEKFINLYPGTRQCKRLFIGDCQMDGMIWASRIATRGDIFPKTLAKCLAAILDPINKELMPTIVSAYGLDTSATLNTPQSMQPVLEFGNDITFLLPAYSFMNTWPKALTPNGNTFLYHFDCPNPWDGPWKGHATHGLDLMFVLQNYHDHLALGQQYCAERFASDIVAFVNGKDPWPAPPGHGRHGSKVYFAAPDGEKDESLFVADESSPGVRRRRILQTVVNEEYWDRLFDAWQMFLESPQ